MTDAKKPMAEANRISTIRFMQDIPLTPADRGAYIQYDGQRFDTW